jgi:hypothetical protein
VEPFLGKVTIMSKNVIDVAATHFDHRDTVRQAIAFVRPLFIQFETSGEHFSRMRKNNRIRVLDCMIAYCCSGPEAS